MRNISFAKTLRQVRRREKTVTRRTGWAWLEAGTLLRPVEKAMGLKKGESITPIFDDGTCIRVVDVRREQLDRMVDQVETIDCAKCHGQGHFFEMKRGQRFEEEPCPKCLGHGAYDREPALEGFPGWSCVEFVEFFCEELRATPDTEVTRIEFEYIDGGAQASLLGEGATDGS